MEVEDSLHQDQKSESVLQSGARAAVEDAPDVGLENKFSILSHRDIISHYQTFRYLRSTLLLSQFKSL